MWAWGFLSQRLLPSAVVMLTTYTIVIAVIAVFRVKSRNARIALLILPLYKSLVAIVVGIPKVDLPEGLPLFIGMKLPDVDQLSLGHTSTPDLFLGGSGLWPQTSPGISWMSAFNWVLAALVIVSGLIVAYRLGQFLVFYRRVSCGQDIAGNDSLRGAAQRAAAAMAIRVPKVVSIDVPQAFVPFTMGWRRPVVVLPGRLLDPRLLDDDQLEGILAHEFAHIKRRDYLLNWVFSLACTLLFYNPLTKQIISRAYEAAEEACDGLAVRKTQRPEALVDALVRVARETSTGAGGIRKLDPRVVPAAVQSYTNTLMSGQRLKERIIRIETGEALRLPRRWSRLAKMIPLASFLTLVALIQINVAIPVGGHLLFLQ